MSEPINPAQPSSIGALLAEEWTIDPYATLPSFVECVMMEEATRTLPASASTVMDAVERYLARWSDHQEPLAVPSSLLNKLQQVLLRWRAQLATRTRHFLLEYRLEIMYLGWYLLERRTLQASSATVAETLYGGRRVKVDAQGRLSELSSTDQTRLALLLTLLPYFKARIERYRERHVSGHTVGNVLLRDGCPMVLAAIQSLTLLCKWRYLMGRSWHYDLRSWCLGQVVRRVTQADQPQSNTTATDEKTDATAADAAGLTQTLASLATVAIAWSWANQIRSYWLQSRPTAASIPPPPPVLPLAVSLPKDRCPLCKRPRVQPTASSSGAVFCWACLSSHVRQFGTCPLTGEICRPDDMIRLYEPHQ